MMKVSLVLMLAYLPLLLMICSPTSVVDAKNVGNNHHDDCIFAVNFFKSLENFNSTTTTKATNNQDGSSMCGGKCCNSNEESQIFMKSDDKLKNLIKHQLKTLHDLWETTFVTYKELLMDMVNHSENKTLQLFKTVYRRMFPLTQQPITQLYESIRSHISTTNPSKSEFGLETTIENFFKNLFPLAYHHAVESHESDEIMEELNVDYKNCLRKSYENLKPFGDIPQTTSRILTQSIGSSNIFLHALNEGGRIVGEMEKFSTENLSLHCRKALFKMDYCGMCGGYANSKPCHSYCSNVLSGCLTFFTNGLEGNWGSFVDTMENLVTTRNKEMVDKTIKTLDGKLSEAIMHAMANGPDLKKKLISICGSHGSRVNSREKQSIKDDNNKIVVTNGPKINLNNLKYSAPPESEFLKLLSNLEKYKKFALHIANQYCEDESYKTDDFHCWNGESVGKYSHQIVDIYSQKYNPEIPDFQNLNNHKALNELNDQILSLRNSINRQIASLSKIESDNNRMLSDMGYEGSHDEEYEDMDDEDIDDFSGSGDQINEILTTTNVLDATVVVSKNTNSASSLSEKRNLLAISIVLLSITMRNFVVYV